MKPYYEAGGVTLYHADFRDVIAATPIDADVVIADPPYGETALAWDRWPVGWPVEARKALHPTRGSMWCFGSMRMFLDRVGDFAGWRFAQDVVWEKGNGSGFAADRFRRVHEHALHWYPSDVKWSDIRHEVPRVANEKRPTARIIRHGQPAHTGKIGPGGYAYDGERLTRSVIYASNCRGFADNETQKPEAIVRPLIEYSCPPGGLVFSPFAGSGTDLLVARDSGRRAIGCEMREEQCEAVVRRLRQQTLFAGGAA